MENNSQDFNNCKHHNVGRYNCWVGWPLRCILETKSKKHCDRYEPKEEKIVEPQKPKQETTTAKCQFFRRRNLLQWLMDDLHDCDNPEKLSGACIWKSGGNPNCPFFKPKKQN